MIFVITYTDDTTEEISADTIEYLSEGGFRLLRAAIAPTEDKRGNRIIDEEVLYVGARAYRSVRHGLTAVV